MAGILGRDDTTNQMTYDLRRLRLHGLVERIPHTNTYTLTSEGIRVAVFFTKLDRRLLHPCWRPIDHLVRWRSVALATIDHAVADYVTRTPRQAAA